MKLRNKLISGLMAVALLATSFSATAFAEETTYDNGTYTAETHMYKADANTTTSMCDSIFCTSSDVVLSDDSMVVTLYVAYPIPAYPTMGTDGTLKDVVATYNETSYTGVIDITTKPTKTFTQTGSMFGITAGDELECETITFTFPRAAVSTFLGDGFYISAYVNSVMYTTQYFYYRASSLTANEAEVDPTDTQTAEVTATVDNQPTYTVTVPTTVAMGTLSNTEDTTKKFDVTVKANYFAETNSITVKMDATGDLTSGDNKLAFTNDFGEQAVTEDGTSTLSGNLTVKAADVAAAASGNYTGTATFKIYFK